jgi:hypothetical protein
VFFEWHEQFKEGCENMENDERSEVHSDRCVSKRTMSVQLNLDKETVICIEKGLNFGP